jgi:hypothetical protein
MQRPLSIPTLFNAVLYLGLAEAALDLYFQ